MAIHGPHTNICGCLQYTYTYTVQRTGLDLSSRADERREIVGNVLLLVAEAGLHNHQIWSTNRFERKQVSDKVHFG